MRSRTAGAPLVTGVGTVVVIRSPGWSADEAGALRVERPAGDEVLHRDGVVAGAQAVLEVELVRGGHGVPVELDAQAGCGGDGDRAVADLQRLAGQRLPVLPDPVRVQGGD